MLACMPIPKRRRWFSLSLRTLLIGMTLISGLFGWFLHHRREKIAERNRLLKKYPPYRGVLGIEEEPVHLIFADHFFGYELPDERYSAKAWQWLRPLSVPFLDGIFIEFNDGNPISEEVAELSRRSSYLDLNGSEPVPPGTLERLLSRRTRDLNIDVQVADHELDAIGQAPNLRSFDSYFQPLKAESLQALFAHRGLNELEVWAEPGELARVSPTGRSYLRSLQLGLVWADEVTGATEGTYAWVQDCTQMEELEIAQADPALLKAFGCMLGGVPQLDVSLGAMARTDCLQDWRRLRRLTIYFEGHIDDRDVSRLCATLPQLEYLDLSAHEAVLSPTGLSELQRLPNLKHLALECCGLTKEHVVAVANFSQLETLSLHGNLVDDAAVQPLSGLTHLRVLDLGSTKVSSGTFGEIRNFFKTRFIHHGQPNPMY
jgi:hypothetical protein